MTGAAPRPSAFAFTRPGPLRLYSTSELLRLPPPRWLIQDILPAGGLIGLYGPPGTGKSFIGIDMAMAVATGRPWHGRTTEQGFVLYVSAEGGTGIGKRVAAWLSHHHVKPELAKVGWLTESVPVHSDSEDMDVLFGRLNDEIEQQPALVIIDTLARCFDGDENQQEDMGRFIAGVDRLRREFEATVIVVHHTRLDGDRERGNTAFRGAADTMCSIERKPEGPLLLSCNKQKDAEEFTTLPFSMQVIPVLGGLDTSCVIVDEGLDRAETVLRALSEGPMTYTDLKTGLTLSPATLKRALMSLVKNGEIAKKNGKYAISRAHQKST